MAQVRSPGVQIPDDAFGSTKVFQTRDLGEACVGVSKVLNPHRLHVISAHGSAVDAHMQHVQLDRISLNRIAYGATVQIEPDQIEDFFLVHLSLSGGANICCGKKSVQTSTRIAAVLGPRLPLHLRIMKGCDHLLIKFDRALMERCCAQYLGYGLSHPIEFDLGMELDSDQAQPWCRLVELLVATAANKERGQLYSPLFFAQYPMMAASTLLLTQPNNYTEELRRPARPIAPYYIKRAEEYINSRAEMPISVGELAEYAGVSARALYAGFQRFRGISPMALVKSVRLHRVHNELLEAKREKRVVTVTEVAMRWGFNHLGYFAADYKREFGVSPSEILAQSMDKGDVD